VQFELLSDYKRPSHLDENCLLVGARSVPLRFVRHRRARRYVLRLGPDGTARVTIPRGGSVAEGKGFAERNVAWLERQLVRQATLAVREKAWLAGAEILFRGERVRLEVAREMGLVRFGLETMRVADATGDLRPAIERYLWRLAARELSARALELAAIHGFSVGRVTVRNQRSRWGSCSRRGTLSLNWRLIQTPRFVSDYILRHELAHLKEMNHSARFWIEVERLCPDFVQAERWLKEHSGLLR
jgi:predicted metal-dependent hydrolase